jgi:hypothetical protein
MSFEAGPTSVSIAAPSFAMSTGISADDAIALLPERAQSRLTALHQRVADLHAGMPDFADVRELAEAKVRHTNRIGLLTRPRTEAGFGLPPEAPQVVAERRSLERAEKEMARLTRLRDDRGNRWQVAAQLERSVIEWLTQGGVPGGCALATVEDDDIGKLLKKGERIADGVERHRHRRRDYVADRHRVNSSAWPSSGKKADAKARIEQLGDAGAPNLDAMIEHNAQLTFPTVTSSSLVCGTETPALAFSESVDALGVLCWLFRDQMLAKINAEIDAIADDKHALDQQQREQMEAQISADMLAVERMEVAMIFAAEAKGEIIDFRADTAPQAVLGVRLVQAPYRAPDHAGHAFDIVGGRR